MRNLVAGITIFVLLPSIALAACTQTWSAANSSVTWNDVGNWTGVPALGCNGQYPGQNADDLAVIHDGGGTRTYYPQLNADQNFASLTMSGDNGASSAVSIDLNDFALTLSTKFRADDSSGTTVVYIDDNSGGGGGSITAAAVEIVSSAASGVIVSVVGGAGLSTN